MQRMFLLLVSHTKLAALDHTGNVALQLQTKTWCCKQTLNPIASTGVKHTFTAQLRWHGLRCIP